MPVLKNSTYNPSFAFKNKHVNTVYRSLFNAFENEFSRNRLELDDGDFIDLDISSVKSKKAILAIHGLEGSSKSSYILSLTHELNINGFDMIALNLRGCSGEQNRLLGTYHSGKTDDLEAVINYINEQYDYDELHLVGFSLGGNLCLKYLGQYKGALASNIKSGIGVSVPCDLAATAKEMDAFSNRLYLNQFLKTLKTKTIQKLEKFPDSFLKKEDILAARTFTDFDNLYTAPAFGFKNAQDYWQKASCKPFLEEINVPTLLINAQDDPFFNEDCFPFEAAKNSSYLMLEAPLYGGHVGYCTNLNPKKNLWCEHRILSFLREQQ